MTSAPTENEKKVLTMAEYIERKSVYEDFEKCNGENPKWTPSRVKTLIARQKAADVATVRHGRWIASHDEFCACSICKYPVYVGWNQTNYCPNCGAKMDGGTN